MTNITVISSKKTLLLDYSFILNPHRFSTLHIFIRSFLRVNPQCDFTHWGKSRANVFLLLLLLCFCSVIFEQLHIQTFQLTLAEVQRKTNKQTFDSSAGFVQANYMSKQLE